MRLAGTDARFSPLLHEMANGAGLRHRPDARQMIWPSTAGRAQMRAVVRVASAYLPIVFATGATPETWRWR